MERPQSLQSRFLKASMTFSEVLLLVTGLMICFCALYLSTRLHIISQVMALNHDPELVMLIFGIFILITSIIGHMTITSKNPVIFLQMLIMFLIVQLVLHVTCSYVSISAISTLSIDSRSRIEDFERAVSSYNEKDNAKFVDGIQREFGCCGLTKGYVDWNKTSAFKCSDFNPSPQRCHVPESCCKTHEWSLIPIDDGVTRLYMFSGAYDPPQVLPPVGSTFSCGAGLLRHSYTLEQLRQKIFTQGCVHVVKEEFKNILLFTGCIGIVVVLVLTISLMLALLCYCGLHEPMDDEIEQYPELATILPL